MFDADRWITIKPNGKENKGVPIKVDENNRVVAGAGGKLNGKKLGKNFREQKKLNSEEKAKRIDEIKKEISQLEKESNRKPKTDLLKELRHYGVSYSNAGKIDKEAFKNMRVFNKKGGLQDDPARWLEEHGYMARSNGRTYEEQEEINEEAYRLIERALNGEKIYKLDDDKEDFNSGYSEYYKNQLEEELQELEKYGIVKREIENEDVPF